MPFSENILSFLPQCFGGNNKYVYFDYSCSLTTGDGATNGIFAWDQKAHIYRYWWFENSGDFSEAARDFIHDETLFLKWHDTSLIQTFKKIDNDKLILKMDHKSTRGKYDSP